MKCKKGVSAVMATVALILITVTAAVVIAGFLVPFVRNNLQEGSECFPYRDYLTFEEEFGYNCYNTTDGSKSQWVSVRAGSVDEETEEEIEGLRLAFIAQGTSDLVDVIEGDAPTTEVFMLAGGNMAVPKSGEVRTYIYDKDEVFDSVRVAPILENGRVCEESDSIDINVGCG